MMPIEKYPCADLSLLPSELGQIVAFPSGEPTFKTDILAYWDGIASWKISGETGIGWFELRRRPFTGNEVERHALTPEGLFCFQGAAACLIGKPKDPKALVKEDFQAFHVEPGQGIIFAPGAWHALPFPLTEKASFWVIFRKGTAQEDLQVIDLQREGNFGFRIIF
jgi:hypothetical protein